jgi:hypothetical protein
MTRRVWLTFPSDVALRRNTTAWQPCPTDAWCGHDEDLLDNIDKELYLVEWREDGRIRVLESIPWTEADRQLLSITFVAQVLSCIPAALREQAEQLLETAFLYVMGDATHTQLLDGREVAGKMDHGRPLWLLWSALSDWPMDTARSARTVSHWPDATRALQWVALCETLNITPFEDS